MASKVTYKNPTMPGFAPDPSLVLVDGVYYLVNSSFHIFPGLPIYASRDLRHWALIGNAINRPEQLSLANATSRAITLDTGDLMIATGGLFAATIRHHEGKFYIVCTNCDTSEGSTTFQNFIIHTSDIWADKWSDPVPVDFHGIDPSLFFDDDGKVYFQGCFVIDRSKQPSCTIKQFEIDLETGKPLSEEREIWGGHAKHDTEGPHVYKVGGWYYLLVAEGGTFEHHMLSIARSKDVWGPYEGYEKNPILTADGNGEEIQNVGHGELFQDARGQWWAVVLGVWRLGGIAEPSMGRESFLTPVEWPEGGWPQIAQPKMQFERAPAEAPATAEKADTSPLKEKDGAGYLYIRDPDFSKYRMQDADIFLRPSREGLSVPTGTCTFIGTRQRSPHNFACVRLDLSGDLKAVRTGMAMYRDHVRHGSLVYDSETRTLSCRVVNSATGLDRVSTKRLHVDPQLPAVWMIMHASEFNWGCFVIFGDPPSEDGPGGEGGIKKSDVERRSAMVGNVEVKELDARDFTGPIIGLFAEATAAAGEETEVRFSAFNVMNMPDPPSTRPWRDENERRALGP